MKINNRVIVILGVAVCSLLVALAIISHFFILTTFTEIENNQATADMQSVLSRFNNQVEDVAAVCRQWARWDDTYAFIENLDPAYIDANLAGPGFFQNLQIHDVLYYNSAGRLVYSRGYNPKDGSMQEVPLEIIRIVSDSIVSESFPEGISGRRGYALVNGKPAVIAGYHITTSDQQGPPRGTLVMVRELDSGTINDLAQQTEMEITVRPMTGTGDAALFSASEITAIKNGAILLRPVNETVMIGTTAITGIENVPTKILVEVSFSRPISRQVQVSITYIIGAIILLALILIIAIRWPLRKYIVSPIVLLDSGLREISRSGDVSRQVVIGGDDEIQSLAASLNLMLEEINKAQQKILESESRFRTLAETSVAGIFVFRKKILYVNPAAELQTGYSQEELLDMNFWDFVHPDFQERVRERGMQRQQGSNVASRIEFKIIRKDGGVRWIDASTTGFLYDGEPASFSVRVDITEHKHLEEALRENEEKFRALAENTPDIIFSTDHEGIFTYISPQAEKYGFAVDKVVGMPVFAFVFPDDLPLVRESFQRVMEGGHGIAASFRIIDNGQNIRWLEANSTPVLDKAGNCTGLQGMLRDITERRQALNAITLANKKLNLMYDITRHDILNKITILFGLIDMTRASPSAEEREQFLREIGEAGNAIHRQIALTRDYQEVGINAPQWNPIGRVIERSILNFSGSGMHVLSTVKDLEIYADPLLEKVIYNLMDNAIRYGKKITTISFSLAYPDNGLELICEDDGIGIDAGLKEKIFERGFGNNTGLGLFLCREILMITGITIRETGEPGKGARFVMYLPKGTYRFVER